MVLDSSSVRDWIIFTFAIFFTSHFQKLYFFQYENTYKDAAPHGQWFNTHLKNNASYLHALAMLNFKQRKFYPFNIISL